MPLGAPRVASIQSWRRLWKAGCAVALGLAAGQRHDHYAVEPLLPWLRRHRRLVADINGVTIREKPAGSPRIRRVTRMVEGFKDDHG